MRPSGSKPRLRADPLRRRSLRVALPLALGLLASATGQADTITVSFIGRVTTVDAAIASDFTVGHVVVGSFQFDSTTADTEPAPTIGEYFDALGSLSVHFDRYGLALGPLGGEVFTSLRSFGIQASALGSPVAGFPLSSFPVELVLSNPSDVFANDAIPSQLDLASFATRRLDLSFLDGSSGYVVQSSVDALIYTVPEPGQLGLLGVGVGWIGGLSRRRGSVRVLSRFSSTPANRSA